MTLREALDVYADALRHYREAQERLRSLLPRLSGDVAQALAENPLIVAPQGVETQGRIPVHIMTGPHRREVDFSSLPNVVDVMEALTLLHRTHARAQDLYAWLLPSYKARVEAP